MLAENPYTPEIVTFDISADLICFSFNIYNAEMASDLHTTLVPTTLVLTRIFFFYEEAMFLNSTVNTL